MSMGPLSHWRLIRLKKRWKLIACLAAALLCLISCALAEGETAERDGSLRVHLKSLGDVSSLQLQLAGDYTLDGDAGMRFDRDTVIAVQALGDALYLKVGGFTMRLGHSVTLTRHAAEGETGLYIEGSARGGLYMGDLTLTAEGGVIRFVLTIGIEDYLYGVVPYEMSDSFPLEALKAQAVAARTYALQRKSGASSRDYDVVDTTADQVFFGYNASYQNAIAAVDQTRGMVGLYGGEYATCFYTASNGGQTALPGDVFGSGDRSAYGYLDIHDDPYDLENPDSPVRSLSIRTDASGLPELLAGWMKAAAAEELASMGYDDDVQNIFLDSILSVSGHDPLYAEPCRMYARLRIEYTLSACPVSIEYEPVSVDELLRAALNDRPVARVKTGETVGEPELVDRTFVYELDVYDQLKDQLGLSLNGRDYEIVTVETALGDGGTTEGFIVTMRRYGHGVGMSQRGAQWMAGEYGKSYQEILAFYYPGLTFETQNLVSGQQEALGALPLSGADEPLPEAGEGERYATVSLSTPFSTLNVRSAPSTDAQILATLRDGDRVIVAREEGEWSYIRTARIEGYVAGSYLTKD